MQRVQTLLDPCHQRLVVSVEHSEPVAHGARGEHIDIGARKAFTVDERRGYATHVARLERLRQVQHLLLERLALAIERQELLSRRHRVGAGASLERFSGGARRRARTAVMRANTNCFHCH